MGKMARGPIAMAVVGNGIHPTPTGQLGNHYISLRRRVIIDS